MIKVIRKIFRWTEYFIRKYLIPVGSFRRKMAIIIYSPYYNIKNIFIKGIKKEKAKKINRYLEKSKIKYLRDSFLKTFIGFDRNEKKKILIIPSWYPTTQAPLLGTFFQEQSNLMQSEYDARVLYGQPKNLRREPFILRKSAILTLPTGISFFYDVNPKYTESDNFEINIRSHETILQEIIKRGWKPDLIHAHCTVYGGIVANYLGKKFNIPTMITENQMFLLHKHSEFMQNKIVEALQETDKVAAASTDKIKFILMHGIKCDPVVVGNLVDDELFNINEKKTVSGKFEILIVAGASFIKDLPTFFKSVKEMIDQGHMDIHATIVGNATWGAESYADLVRELQIVKYCTFIDSAIRLDMPQYYHSCDVFVSSSIAEGFQVSILEAMACGKPVVSTNHGGVEDNLRPENGILVNIRDYKAIADALIRIKNHEIIYDPVKIRQTVVEKYGKIAFKKKISSIYKELIDGKKY